MDLSKYLNAQNNPEYNGPRICPKCGAPSQWRAVEADGRMVRVECSGSCGTYEEPYTSLSNMRDFNPNPST
jgi:hypothetical protein